LYARATGYEYDAVKIFCNKDGKVTKVKYRERLAPDTTACIFWLKNRRKDLWRERPEAEQPLAFDPNESIEDTRRRRPQRRIGDRSRTGRRFIASCVGRA